MPSVVLGSGEAGSTGGNRAKTGGGLGLCKERLRLLLLLLRRHGSRARAHQAQPLDGSMYHLGHMHTHNCKPPANKPTPTYLSLR